MAETVGIILARIEERVKSLDEKIDIKIAEIKEDTLYLRNNNKNQWQAIDENSKKTAQIKPIWWVLGIICATIGGIVTILLK